MTTTKVLSVKRSAQFDQTGQYRYWLGRIWDESRPAIALIMLNPSRADQQRDDPTLRRCIGLAQQWQCGSLEVVNLFAFCTASPKILKTAPDPIGAENDRFILQACHAVERIILAWGNGGNWLGRDSAVLELLLPYRDRLFHLGQTNSGSPRHPLYLPRQTRPIPWLPVNDNF